MMLLPEVPPLGLRLVSGLILLGSLCNRLRAESLQVPFRREYSHAVRGLCSNSILR
jgi:hypothetical protein